MKKYIIILIFIATLSSPGCEKFLDVNHDPDALVEAPVDKMLAGPLAASLYVTRGNWQVIGGYWAQHWTQSTNAPQFQDYDKYLVGNSTFSRGYGTIFASSLKELDYIKSVALETENWAYYLIATCVTAYNYQLLVDVFDQVPYDDALQGDLGIYYPKFNEGSDIYDKLIVELDDALSKDFYGEFVEWPPTSTEDNPSVDIIFDGDGEKWRSFANTLKLKMFVRQRFARPTVASAGIDALLSSGENILNEDVGYNDFTSAADRMNTMYAINFTHAGNITVSNTLISYMMEKFPEGGDVARDSIRLTKYAMTPKNDAYPVIRGLVQGDFLNSDYARDVKDLSKPFLTATDYQYYFTKSEIKFLLSEAYLMRSDYANAQLNYEDGITASFERLGISANATDVINGYAAWANYSTDEEKLKAISEQRWISMVNYQGLEAFIEQNRTGYPDFFEPAVNNSTSDRFPSRFLIPQDEISSNPNIPSDLVSAQIFDKVWWDAK